MANELERRLRSALTAAMKSGDREEVKILRSTLAAVDNAGAVPMIGPGSGAVEDSPVGVGITEAQRRELSENDVVAIIDAEIIELEQAASIYRESGNYDRSETLRLGANTLRSILE